MPRPPVLPTIDWAALYASATEYDAWLKTGEKPESSERMEADRKAFALTPPVEAFLGALPRPVHVIAIAESWCGDVVRHVPVLQKMADASPNLKVRYIAREDRPDVFARFLTNGGEAIPKFVFLSDQYVECGNWGPMPDACRELIARGKACGDVGAARKKVSALYEADGERNVVVSELLHLADISSASAP
jgi:Thioredoxin